MKNVTLIILIFFVAIVTLAQTSPDTLWTKTYGGTSNDDAIAVIQTIDSCFVFLGHAESSGNTDIWLTKIDDYGNILWDKTFGGPSWDFGIIVKQTPDQGFIIVGTTESFGNGDRSIWLTKTDKNGNELWNKVFDETIDNTCQAQFVSFCSDGGYIITGSTGNHTLNHLDAWLIKTDENGIEEWNKKLGGLENQKTYRVFQLNDGGYILSGYTSSNDNKADIWLFKTDEIGNILWEKTFGGSEWDYAYAMQITSDNGYILAGFTKSYGNGEEDFWLIKTDSLGNEIWNTIYGESQNDVIYSIQQTQDGGYIGGGLTNSFDAMGFDMWIVKTDSQGNISWSKIIGGAENEFAFSVSQIFDDGYILAGRTNSFGNGNDDAYVARIKPETANAINNSTAEISLLNTYPNPFTNSTTVEYKVKNHSKVSLKIYDLHGKEVKTLTDGYQTSGTKTIVWDGTNNSRSDVIPGLYYFTINVNNNFYTKKIVTTQQQIFNNTVLFLFSILWIFTTNTNYL